MTNLSNTALGGTSGSAITTSDTASGNKWDVATPGTGGTANWDNSQAVHDPLSMTFATGVTSTSAYVAWTSGSIGSLARIWGRAYVRLPASPPTVTQVIARFLAASAQKARIYCNTSGKLVIADSSNVAAGTTTGTVAANSWFRVEWDITSGVSNAFEFRYYASPESYTATETLTGSTTNFGAANFDEVRFGVGANFASVVGYWIDDVNVNDIGFPGPSQLWTPPAQIISAPAYVQLPPKTTILRSSLADVVVASSTTPQPIVVTAQPPPVLPPKTTILRASLQDFATPVTTQPIVVTQAGLRATIPTPAIILRASLQDFATPTTPAPLVVSASVRWQLPPPTLISRAPQAALAATTGTAPVVVTATSRVQTFPAIILRTAAAGTTVPLASGAQAFATSGASLAATTSAAGLASAISAGGITTATSGATLTSTTSAGKVTNTP